MEQNRDMNMEDLLVDEMEVPSDNITRRIKLASRFGQLKSSNIHQFENARENNII